MSHKVLACDVVGIDEFMQNAKTALNHAQAGTVAVFSDNAPLFYALTPARMAQLLAMEERAALVPAINPCGAFARPLFSPMPVGKFAMYANWQPDADFQRMAALWGVHLAYPVTAAELLAFVSYWQAEGKMFHHVQWQQKLARNVQISRNGTVRRDINTVSLPDEQIPDGFKG